MFFWPMINNPALYHLTYFPFMFLVTGPFVWFFDHFGFVWDQRYLYLPAYVGTLALVPFIVKGAAERLAMTPAIALNPQLFPFVVQGGSSFSRSGSSRTGRPTSHLPRSRSRSRRRSPHGGSSGCGSGPRSRRSLPATH